MDFDYVIVANFSKSLNPFERMHRNILERDRTGRDILRGNLSFGKRYK